MERFETGIAGLDRVLGGGLPVGSLVVVGGPSGTGKTIMVQQMCFAAAARGQKALYYSTLSESHSKVIRHLEQFAFFDDGALGRSVQLNSLAALISEGAASVVDEVVRKAFDDEPQVIAIDSSKVLAAAIGDRDFRGFMFDFAARISHSRSTLVFVGEYAQEEMELGVESSISDLTIRLERERFGLADRRWLSALKVRGTNYLTGQHALEIGPGGIEVFPRVEASRPEASARVGERISTGAAGLDEMMGGGIPMGGATVVLGPAGAGKTALALGFVARGVAEGERCLYISFQESEEQLEDKAASFGWDFVSARESGLMRIVHTPPVELNLDAVGELVRTELLEHDTRRIVFDSLAELSYAARATERFPAYGWSLVRLIRAGGASLMVTSEAAIFGPAGELAGGLSFLFDNMILLRYMELESEMHRALNVFKMRSSVHDKGLVQFEIDEHGIKILRKLDSLVGVLGWTALRRQETAYRELQ